MITYVDLSWAYVGGSPSLSKEGAEYISLAVDKNGSPLVAFQVPGARLPAEA